MAEGPSILVVEDDEHIAYLLDFMLRREGFAVHLARDGLEAESMIADLAPTALVLLDIMLPYRDGFQLIAHLRALEAWREVPVVMLTSKSQESEVVRALEAGANDYVTKPFKPKELMARLRRLLANPR
jgi:DNA-binding response OmpR family regulator